MKKMNIICNMFFIIKTYIMNQINYDFNNLSTTH